MIASHSVASLLLPNSAFLRLPISSSHFHLSLKYLSSLSVKSPEPSFDDHVRNLVCLFNSFRDQNHYYHTTQNRPTTFDHELALVSALKTCTSLSAVPQGEQLHSLVLKSGLTSNVFIHNSLINMYAKCGRMYDAKLISDSLPRLDVVSCNIMLGGYFRSGWLDDARHLFDVMPVKGCVAYTTVIKGLKENNKWEEAVAVFKDMRLMGVTPNVATMTSVISSYCHLGGIWDAKVLHGLATKLGLEGFVFVSTDLLKMYCLCSSLDDGRNLFDTMEEKTIVSWNVMLNGYAKGGFLDSARDLFETSPVRDVVSWGTIIDAYVRAGELNEALRMYRSMLHTGGVRPNDVMIVDLVSACGRLLAIKEGQQLHGSMIKAGFDCYNFIQSTIIHFYALCGEMGLACLQFKFSIKDHLPTWNTLLSGFVRNGMIDQAREMFNEMPERDIFSWSSMISGYSQNGQPEKALELFREMLALRIHPNEVTMVSVISAIGSLGTLSEGKWAVEYIMNNSIFLNDNLIAALIDMYAKCGSITSSLEFFNQVRERVSSISPWNAIIFGLAMHGLAHPSLQLFKELQKLDIDPNSITFIGVLTACCHAGMVEAGKQYFNIMKTQYGIDPNIKHYGCMIDLLSRSGLLQEADEMRSKMPMEADVVIWGTLLANSRTHGNVEIGEKAAKHLAMLDTSHGASRVLLSNLYADSERWDDVSVVRRDSQDSNMNRLPGCSGVV